MNPFRKIYMRNMVILINFIISLFIRGPTISCTIAMSVVVVSEFGEMPKNYTNCSLHCIKFIWITYNSFSMVVLHLVNCIFSKFASNWKWCGSTFILFHLIRLCLVIDLLKISIAPSALLNQMICYALNYIHVF